MATLVKTMTEEQARELANEIIRLERFLTFLIRTLRRINQGLSLRSILLT